MYSWDDDAMQQEQSADNLPKTVPGYAPERLGCPVEPRSDEHEEQLFQRICTAMRDASGAWVLPFGLGLTWSLLQAPGPFPWAGESDERETYAIRMMTVHAVEVTDEESPWQPPRFDVRQESLWLMHHHLEAIELEKPRLYGGTARVLLSAPPLGASDHTPLQAVEITIAHASPGGRPEGDPNAFWATTHLLRARDMTAPLVLAMGSRPPILPG